jgi:MtN3 and saliva related transmembrane protein
MDAYLVELLGMVAGTLTTAAFIPQVYQIFKTRNVASISLFMYVIFTAGVGLWLIYGLINGQASLIMANGITFVLAATILVMKIRIKPMLPLHQVQQVQQS